MAGRTRKTTTTAETEVITEEVMNPPIEEDSTSSVIEEKQVVEKTVKKKVKTIDDYKPDDKILCHSVFSGKLIYTGGSTGITYEFVNFGAKRYVQYQDLEHGLLARKGSITSPLIIIDDEELLATDLWEEIKLTYDEMYNRGDLMALVKLPLNSFKKEFAALPINVQKTVSNIISTQIAKGTFDSMNKAKIVDETIGTSLLLMMQ